MYTHRMASGAGAGSPTAPAWWRDTARLGVGAVSTIVFVVLMVCGASRSVEASTITLRDGSTISGEIVSLSDGVYTIRSATLGTLTVKQADVRTLTDQAATPMPAQLDALRERIATDPATMSAIAALADDPDVQAILGAPEVRAALQDGNLDALLSNPKIARLAADPRVRSITEKFTAGAPAAAGGSSH